MKQANRPRRGAPGPVLSVYRARRRWMNFTSSTTGITSTPSIAAQRTRLWPRRVNTLRRWDRMLKLWKISHMLMVKKAMVMPSGETPRGISK